jgi:intein/homing endonuclease
MGIFQFYSWFRKTFPEDIYKVDKSIHTELSLEIDNLLIDMNGLFHTSAQKVFKYGSFKPHYDVIIKENNKTHQLVFKDICETLENILMTVNPRRKIILCVDGPAPIAKQCQQRKRRYKSSLERGDDDKSFDSNCLTEDTLVSISNGRCRPIYMLENNNKKIKIVTLGENNTIEYTEQTKFFNQGCKDTLIITFQDGRTIKCTPEHKLMTSKGEWKEAKDLNESDSVVFGIMGAIDIPNQDEIGYKLLLGDLIFSTETDYERERLLAFARINGIILSDGSSANYIRKSTGKEEPYGSVTLGTIIDANELIEDIKLVCGQTMSYTFSEDRSYRINLPAIISRAINLSGVSLGKRIDNEIHFPKFIVDNNCPVSVIKEFLGGYFGGDGHAPGFGKVGESDTSRNIKFSHSTRQIHLKNMEVHMKILIELLNKVNIKSVMGITQKINKTPNKFGYTSNGDYDCIINVQSTNDFIKKVGFRYCRSKAIRAEAIASYNNLKEKILQARTQILQTALELYNTNAITAVESLKKAIKLYKSNNVVIHPYCIPSSQTIHAVIRNKKIPCTLNFIRGLNRKEYLKEINAYHFFGDHSGGLNRIEKTPTMNLKFISSKTYKKLQVYDISVNSESTSFLANGIGVHNCITPGTKFMDHLSKYIDWFIRKRISENPLWQNIEVIYSPSSVPSEGEQKLLSYIRKFGDKNESFVIHGLDADLIMLSLLTHYSKFYVLRDDTFDYKNNFLLVDIGSVRKKIVNLMKWEKSEEALFDFKFNNEWAINDFVFTCFIAGNDFLPHIPSIEIIEGGVEVIIEISKNVGRTHGHITRNKTGNIVFCKSSLKKFLEIVSESEKELLEQKFKNRSRYFEDKILEKSATYNMSEHKYEIDIDKFRSCYNEEIFENEEDLQKASYDYLAGLQWILKYYTKEVPSWRWYFPYHYAPTASTLVKYIDSFEFPRCFKGSPLTPLQQLLCVLPPKSSKLLPSPLDSLLSTKLKRFNPDDVEIDVSGKKHEYMGIVRLPFIDFGVMKKVYDENISKVDEKELRRNNFGKSFHYIYDFNNERIFKSYYGDIEKCMVTTKVIEFC